MHANTFCLKRQEGVVRLLTSSVLHGTESVVSDLKGERLAIVGDITLILKEEHLHFTNGYVDQKYWRQF